MLDYMPQSDYVRYGGLGEGGGLATAVDRAHPDPSSEEFPATGIRFYRFDLETGALGEQAKCTPRGTYFQQTAS